MKTGQEGGQTELLLSPSQLLWRGQNIDKYYMLSTWNHKSLGLALKINGENLKAKFVRRLLYYVLALLKSPNMYVLDVIMKCGDDYFFWGRCNYSV